jgi:hypothetical protein
LDKNLAIKVRFEIGQIDKLLDNASPLLKVLALREPDFVELSAAGSVLHSFYNGVENIFVLIEKYYGTDLKDSVSWHKDILRNVQTSTGKREALITRETGEKLAEYLMFRHFFRHAYGFQLDWNKMKHLINNIDKIREDVKREIELFLDAEQLR